MRSSSKRYEIYSGRRVVSTQLSVSPLQAVVDYVRSYGVQDDEIRRLGSTPSRGGALTSAPCSFRWKSDRLPSRLAAVE